MKEEETQSNSRIKINAQYPNPTLFLLEKLTLVHFSRRQESIGRSIRFDVPVSRQHVGYGSIGVVWYFFACQFLDVTRRQIGMDGHDLRFVKGTGHVVVSHGKGLLGGLVLQFDRHELVESVLGHGPGILRGPPGSLIESEEAQKGLGGRACKSIQINGKPGHEVALWRFGFSRPSSLSLVGKPRYVHTQHIKGGCLEGDRHTHVAIEFFPVQSRDQMISMFCKVCVEGASPIVRDFLEANNGGLFDFLVNLFQHHREAILGVEMIRIEGGIVVRPGKVRR